MTMQCKITQLDSGVQIDTTGGRQYLIRVTPDGSLMVNTNQNVSICPNTPRSIEIVSADDRVKRLTRRK